MYSISFWKDVPEAQEHSFFCPKFFVDRDQCNEYWTWEEKYFLFWHFLIQYFRGYNLSWQIETFFDLLSFRNSIVIENVVVELFVFLHFSFPLPIFTFLYHFWSTDKLKPAKASMFGLLNTNKTVNYLILNLTGWIEW